MTTPKARSMPVAHQHSNADMLAGGSFAIVTALIWAIWIVGTRMAVTNDIPLVWILMLRFGAPAVLLIPAWWKVGLLPPGVKRWQLALMVVGSGAPMIAITAAGTGYANSAQIGVLLPGSMPLFVALLSALIDGEKYTPVRIVGFTLSVIALLLIGGPALAEGQGIGFLLLPLGAFLWAVYTIAFRHSGLKATQAAGIVAVWSTVMLIPFAIFTDPTPLLEAPPLILGWQLISQAILSGVVALVAYGAAVRLIGPSRTAIFGALAPALATLLAIPVLGEWPTWLNVAGIVLVVIGVSLASGSVRRRPR